MPVSAQSFSRVTLAGPLVNLAAVPLMAVAQVAGLVVVVADLWPPVASPAGWIAGLAHTSRLSVLLGSLEDIPDEQ